MRVQVSKAVRLFCVALCAACLLAEARAQQKQTEVVPAPTQTPKVEVQTKQESSASKKNARPEAEAGAKPEPFDKATPEQMSKQCVTLATEEGPIEIEFFPEA